MTSPWIEHVKKVAKQKNISYKDALKVASQSYRGKSTPVLKGGAIGNADMKSYIKELKKIKQRAGQQWNTLDEEVLRDFQEVLRLRTDDNISFADDYLNQLQRAGDKVINDFGVGHTESKE